MIIDRECATGRRASAEKSRGSDESLGYARGLGEEAISLLPAGADVATDLLEGSPSEAIVKVAQTRSADEIVVGSRGRGKLRAALGSVSQDVLDLADRPVVVVPNPTRNGA